MSRECKMEYANVPGNWKMWSREGIWNLHAITLSKFRMKCWMFNIVIGSFNLKGCLAI